MRGKRTILLRLTSICMHGSTAVAVVERQPVGLRVKGIRVVCSINTSPKLYRAFIESNMSELACSVGRSTQILDKEKYKYYNLKILHL